MWRGDFYLHSFLKGFASDTCSPSPQSMQPADLSIPKEEHKLEERNWKQYLAGTVTSAEDSCAADQIARN